MALICPKDTGAKRGDIPWGKDHTYQCEVCFPTVWQRGVAHCGMAVEYYLRWRAGMPCRTSCQMWGNWNLHRFLFRDGSMIPMNMASLIVLVMPCASLCTMEKLSTLMTSFIYGGGGPKIFLKPVPKGLSLFSNVLLFTTWLGTFKPVDYPTLLGESVLIPGFTRWLQMVLFPLKWTCTPTLLHTSLKLSLSPLELGPTRWMLWLLVLLFLLLVGCLLNWLWPWIVLSLWFN